MDNDTVSFRLPTKKGCVTIIIKNQPGVSYTFVGDPPGELMDAYQALVGDGKAEVAVGADMGTKDFGNGVSSWLSCKLTCNQDLATMANAATLAGQFARYYNRLQYEEADKEFQAMLAQKKQEKALPTPNFG